MLERFRHKVEELRGLIADLRSASPVISSERSESRNLYLLAVSGGIDSMCLADLWLRCFGPDSFAIAHCNFHLRGEESDGDEALVTKWAEENGVRMHRVGFDTAGYAAENGVSIEMAARELRYRWFGELCEEHGYEAVVVAHHADDNAETLILNMVRGAGLKGLTGMKTVSPLPLQQKPGQAGLDNFCHPDLDDFCHPDHDDFCHPDHDDFCHPRPDRGSVSLLRPLLTFTRKQIEGHVFAWKVPYREDSTNSSVEYRRNSIRHEIFPLFERMNPSYVRTLNREMTYLSDASSIVDEWCLAQLPKVINHDGTTDGHHGTGEDISISTSRLLEIPQWRYLLYYILEPYGFNTSVLESLENLLKSDRTVSGKRFESAGYVLRTERQSLVVVRKMAGQAGHDVASHPGHDVATHPGHDVTVIPDLIGDPFMPVRGAGTYHCNGRRFVVEVLPWSAEMPLQQPAGTLIFDAGKLKFPFVCRKWRKGDWMIPFGMRGRKKISDLFADLKYDALEKESALMIVDCRGEMAEKQHVAAVMGVRSDDAYKVDESTASVIRITVL
ncbi:MAG: tRNA lysidine(34) synthetase TilS [Bacteroidales bacterium]|nr:tRNA lysidine(34) synthetase TilS [Bacteroidales bacterium]